MPTGAVTAERSVFRDFAAALPISPTASVWATSVLSVRWEVVLTPKGSRGRRGGRESSSQSTSAQSEAAPAADPEWFWWGSSLTGRRRAEEEMDGLPVAERAALAAVITRIVTGTTRGGDVRPLAPGILEGRVQVNGTWPRVAYSRLTDGFVGLTVFRKKKNQTEQVDIDRAKDRLRSWRKLTSPR